MTGTILVVEDDLATAGLMREILEGEGYRVLHAVGADGLAVARAERPGVILLDVHMPGMGGPEIARHLRAAPATAGIPIVCLSAGLVRQGAPAGMPHEACLPKPFAVGDLTATVARLIGGGADTAPPDRVEGGSATASP